jgi:hypothetical protein
MARSRTVGMPKGRRRPSGFGMYTRRTGWGRYPFRLRPWSANFIRLSGVLHTTPSMPGVSRPAFCWVTRRTASRFADVERTRSFCRLFTCLAFPAAAAR